MRKPKRSTVWRPARAVAWFITTVCRDNQEPDFTETSVLSPNGDEARCYGDGDAFTGDDRGCYRLTLASGRAAFRKALAKWRKSNAS